MPQKVKEQTSLNAKTVFGFPWFYLLILLND
jgi:hypothetical protein